MTDAGDDQSSRFGAHAVQVLLKRARDDRENLIIILAGYEEQMETFLRSIPGLASQFTTKIRFASYTPAELFAMAESLADNRGGILDVNVRPALWHILDDVGRRRLIDELGNGRFAQALLERARAHRDMRVAQIGEAATVSDLTTLTAYDVGAAYQDLVGQRATDLANE